VNLADVKVEPYTWTRFDQPTMVEQESAARRKAQTLWELLKMYRNRTDDLVDPHVYGGLMAEWKLAYRAWADLRNEMGC